MLRPSSAVPPACVLTAPLLALLTLAAASPVRAHAIESSLGRLQGLHDTLVLDSRFGNGQPAAGARVSLVSPGGDQSVLIGSTDQRGSLRFQVPAGVKPSWELQVDLGAGHRDYLELPTTTTTTVPSVSLKRPAWHWLDGAPWLLVGGVALCGGLWGGLKLNQHGFNFGRKLDRKLAFRSGLRPDVNPDRNLNSRS